MKLEKRMPLLFVGHGSPMNTIEDNKFSRSWKKMGERLGKPKAILVISAHWMTDGPRVSASSQYRQIYDMYGFPEELYQVEYNPPGAPEFAHRVVELLKDKVQIDDTWGLDHGAWSVLTNMYPEADVPVVTMSVGIGKSPREQLEFGRKLQPLREEGVLILGSGNIVHNLSILDWKMEGGFDWADQFDTTILEDILDRDFKAVADYDQIDDYKKAFRTVEHFYPLLNVLGAVGDEDSIEVWNEDRLMGSISMTSYLFFEK